MIVKKQKHSIGGGRSETTYQAACAECEFLQESSSMSNAEQDAVKHVKEFKHDCFAGVKYYDATLDGVHALAEDVKGNYQFRLTLGGEQAISQHPNLQEALEQIQNLDIDDGTIDGQDYEADIFLITKKASNLRYGYGEVNHSVHIFKCGTHFPV